MLTAAAPALVVVVANVFHVLEARVADVAVDALFFGATRAYLTFLVPLTGFVLVLLQVSDTWHRNQLRCG